MRRRSGEAFGFALPQEFSEEAKSETESVLADYFPELKLRATYKSRRGERLGAPKQATPTETAAPTPEPTSEPTSEPTPEPTPAAPAPTPQAPEPTRQPFTWSSNVGGTGFGTEDYKLAISQGYSASEIKDYLTRSSGAFGGGGLNVGADVRSQLDLDTGYQSDLAKIATGQAESVVATPENYQAKTQATGGFGMGALEAAKASGKSTEQIKQYIQAHGLNVGENAKKALGI